MFTVFSPGQAAWCYPLLKVALNRCRWLAHQTSIQAEALHNPEKIAGAAARGIASEGP